MQETHPLITVLLPFFKVGDELDQTIASIAKQSFSDWKLLLISNNGNHERLDITNKWISNDQRVSLINED
jgi:glycosyltransferase involved in cell wall biosynthesis